MVKSAQTLLNLHQTCVLADRRVFQLSLESLLAEFTQNQIRANYASIEKTV